MIGLNTLYNLCESYGQAGDEGAARIAHWLEAELIDKGKWKTERERYLYLSEPCV